MLPHSHLILVQMNNYSLRMLRVNRSAYGQHELCRVEALLWRERESKKHEGESRAKEKRRVLLYIFIYNTYIRVYGLRARRRTSERSNHFLSPWMFISLNLRQEKRREAEAVYEAGETVQHWRRYRVYPRDQSHRRNSFEGKIIL